MKKIFENIKIKKLDIWAIYICLLIFTYTIFIGSPIKDNTQVINLIALITFLIYFLVILIKRRKILKGKLDIFVLLLTFSSYIALFFGNYSNLEATISYLIKYTVLFGLYIIIRDIVKQDKKYINYLIFTFSISGIYIFFIGLDNITFNFSEKFLDKIGNVIVDNSDKRFMSVFGYANTCAILNVVLSIFAITKSINTNSKKEFIFYNVCLFFNITSLIISYSRSCWIIAIVIYLTLIILNKENREKCIEIILRTRNLSFNI